MTKSVDSAMLSPHFEVNPTEICGNCIQTTMVRRVHYWGGGSMLQFFAE